MPLLYDRIIEEIGDQHSTLVERFVQECSGKKPVDSSVFTFIALMHLNSTPISSINEASKHEKEQLESMLIEGIDAGKSDEELYPIIDSFVSTPQTLGGDTEPKY